MISMFNNVCQYERTSASLKAPCFLRKNNYYVPTFVQLQLRRRCVVKIKPLSNWFLCFWSFQVQSQDAAADFAPQVTATCKAGAMNIKILFNSPYSGAVHARDFRNPYCMTFGNGTNIVTMSLNLLAKQGSAEYCGILVSNVSGDVRVTNFAY